MSDDTIIEHSYLSLVNDFGYYLVLIQYTSIILVIDVFIHDFFFTLANHGTGTP